MTRFIELLDRLKEKRELRTDYAAAKVLGISTARMHDYRSGNRNPDNYTLTRIAIELGIDPMTLIAELHAATEKNEKKRTFWRDFFLQINKLPVLAGLICTAFLLAASGNTEAASYIGGANNAKFLTENDIIRMIW